MRGLTVATDELGKSLGLTQKQLDQRAEALIATEQADSRAAWKPRRSRRRSR